MGQLPYVRGRNVPKDAAEQDRLSEFVIQLGGEFGRQERAEAALRLGPGQAGGEPQRQRVAADTLLDEPGGRGRDARVGEGGDGGISVQFVESDQVGDDGRMGLRLDRGPAGDDDPHLGEAGPELAEERPDDLHHPLAAILHFLERVQGEQERPAGPLPLPEQVGELVEVDCGRVSGQELAGADPVSA